MTLPRLFVVFLLIYLIFQQCPIVETYINRQTSLNTLLARLQSQSKTLAKTLTTSNDRAISLRDTVEKNYTMTADCK